MLVNNHYSSKLEHVEHGGAVICNSLRTKDVPRMIICIKQCRINRTSQTLSTGNTSIGLHSPYQQVTQVLDFTDLINR